MSKFKVGDRVVMTKDRDSAQKGMKGTIVATMECGDWGVRFDEKFDGGHDLRGKCETGYGHWIAPDEMEIFEEPKFEVGQIYRVGETSESGNIIRITKNEPSQLRPFCYKTIRGAEKTSSRFGENSRFANSLELLTGSQIGEAIRKYDAEHPEKKTGVREVKRPAKPGEYIKIVYAVPVASQQYADGDIFRVTKDHACFAADVEADGVLDFIDAKEYVVLEGYKPEQKGGIRINGKHVYTAEQVEQAKKLTKEMLLDCFDKEISVVFYAGNDSEVSANLTFGKPSGDSSETATCSDHDEPNKWIGKCVALCKALHKPIPAFVMGDSVTRHFDLEKAKHLAYDEPHHEIGIHCKTQDEIDQLMRELEKLGYTWVDGDKPTEYNSDSPYRFINDVGKTILKDESACDQPCAEFSDCFAED